MASYIDTFFKEKNLDFRIYEIETEENTHLVESEFVISLIKNTSDQERKNIENILRQIDFRNGDVHHFLKHLAEGYVKTHYVV